MVDGKGKEDTRVVLRLHPALAPYTVAVLPLSKKLEDVALPITRNLVSILTLNTMLLVQ